MDEDNRQLPREAKGFTPVFESGDWVDFDTAEWRPVVPDGLLLADEGNTGHSAAGRETNGEVKGERGFALSGLLDKMAQFGAGSRGQGHHHLLGRETCTERGIREALRDSSATKWLEHYGYRVPKTVYGVGRMVRGLLEDWEQDGQHSASDGGAAHGGSGAHDDGDIDMQIAGVSTSAKGSVGDVAGLYHDLNAPANNSGPLF